MGDASSSRSGPMWLLPVLSHVSTAAARIYYRFGVSGEAVPSEGPVLLVANHPNSLLDPALVSASAGRPVRFLAKAPLFSDVKTGWLVRGAGAIPVYRKVDDPSQMAQNTNMFEAVFEALADRSAVGIFPEGISHNEPALAELRTGAARIALGAVDYVGHDFPIVPVGLLPERKELFRSRMQVVVGQPIAWDDLSGRGEEDRDAVRELTDRIDAGLRRVTLNLERWEDQEVVNYAEAIWAASFGAAESHAERVTRLGVTTRVLSDVRDVEDARGLQLYSKIRTHARRLSRLGVAPDELTAETTMSGAVRHAASRFYLFGVPIVVIGVLAIALFAVPYLFTSWAAVKWAPKRDAISTWAVMIGAPVYGLWIGVLAILTGVVTGSWGWGIGALFVLPLIAVAGRRVREAWARIEEDFRRFMTIRSRRKLVGDLARSQRQIAEEIEEIVERWQNPEDPGLGGSNV